MSEKSFVTNFKVIEAQDMTNPITSLPSRTAAQDNLAYQIIYTGTPSGTFLVEATLNGTDWTALAFASPITTNTAPSGSLININQSPYSQIRIRYVPTSGTGTLTVIYASKRLGG